jgi:excisionase family DNA binding protein
MDLATARTRATLSVPEAGQLVGLGRDASYAAADRGEIPALRFGRRLRVPVAIFFSQLGLTTTEPPTSMSPALPHGERLDTETDSEADPTKAGLGNVLAITGARRGKVCSPQSSHSNHPPG